MWHEHSVIRNKYGLKTFHLLIKGKVQGVFYRSSARDKATILGLKGWVANTSDGSVELIVSGEHDVIATFINWCHIGPEAAKVSEVIVNELPGQMFYDFTIKR